MYLLKGHNPSNLIYQNMPIEMSKPFIFDILKSAYWPKKCLLNEKVPIGRKCVYWMKMYLLTEKGSIE